MGHVVHYRSSAGEPRLEDAASLEAAVERIEHLRNEEGAEDVRLFREVPLQVRTYYRVTVGEVAEADAAPPADAVGPEPAADEPPPGAMNLAPPPVTAGVAAPVEGAEEPRRSSLFGRG